MNVQVYQFSQYFGGSWPMYQGQGELTIEEFQRPDQMVGCTFVQFEIEEPFVGKMLRAFRDKAELLRYMRKWGLGATDIRVLIDNPLQRDNHWCVLAYDPFYGTAYGTNGYRRRWYFPTQEEAETFAENCIPAGLRLAEVYCIDRIAFQAR